MRQQVRSRRSVLGAGVAVGAAAGAACAPGGAGGGGGQAPPAGLTSGVRVSFAYPAPPDQAAVMTRAAQAMAEQVPGLTAEYVNTLGQNHTAKITAAMAGGTPIDVFTLSPGEMVPFADKGQVRAIDDLIRRDRYDVTDFFEKCFGQYRWRGRAYALPLDFGNQAIYYSTALSGTPPATSAPPTTGRARGWTAEEFLDGGAWPGSRWAGGVDGRAPRGSGAAPGGGVGLVPGHRPAPLGALGLELRGRRPGPRQGARCILDQAPAVEGLQFLQDLIHKHQVSAAPPSTRVDSVAAMGNGRLGMALGIPALVVRLRQVRGLAFDVAPPPRRATRLTSGGGLGWHHGGGHAPRQRGLGAPAVARLQGGADVAVRGGRLRARAQEHEQGPLLQRPHGAAQGRRRASSRRRSSCTPTPRPRAGPRRRSS